MLDTGAMRKKSSEAQNWLREFTRDFMLGMYDMMLGLISQTLDLIPHTHFGRLEHVLHKYGYTQITCAHQKMHGGMSSQSLS